MTGLTSVQVDRLVSLVRARLGDRLRVGGRPRRLGLGQSVIVMLLHVRQNLAQAVIAELFGCSQATICRVIGLLRETVTEALEDLATAVEERELRSTTRVDGFLVRTGNHRLPAYKERMWSGKRHAAGQNIQLVSTHDGRLVMIGDPVPGATHDAKAWHTLGLAARFTGRMHADGGPGVIGDLGYIGTGVLTGIKHRPGRDLAEAEREFHQTINSRRAPVERAIAHLRNWKMLATGYRGLLSQFPAHLKLITRLELHRTWT